MPLPALPPKFSPEWYEHYAAMHGIAAEVDSGRLTDDALKAQAVDAVEAATTVTPTGAWDFTQAPTVGGVPIGSGTGAGTGNVTGTGVTAIVALTQAEYDALAEKDPATLYVIQG